MIELKLNNSVCRQQRVNIDFAWEIKRLNMHDIQAFYKSTNWFVYVESYVKFYNYFNFV